MINRLTALPEGEVIVPMGKDAWKDVAKVICQLHEYKCFPEKNLILYITLKLTRLIEKIQVEVEHSELIKTLLAEY